MKLSFVVLAAVAASAVLGTGGARADGILTSPGAMTGWDGTVSPNGRVRFVALVGSGRETIVAAVRVRGGRVVRWGVVPGTYGVPLVAYDGTTGGMTADGKTLVLAAPVTNPGAVSSFPVVSTRTLRVRKTIRLRGRFSFDAVSSDASTLYLVEYLGTGPGARYRVRIYDADADRLLRGALVDRLEKEAIMRGLPVTRATSSDGRWAYTLYARQRHDPFVHALDTARREAYCIDLPLRLGRPRQMELRLRLAADGSTLTVVGNDSALAAIDTRSWRVRKT